MTSRRYYADGGTVRTDWLHVPSKRPGLLPGTRLALPHDCEYFLENYPGLSRLSYELYPDPESYCVAYSFQTEPYWISRPILLSQRHMGMPRDIEPIVRSELKLKQACEEFLAQYKLPGRLSGSTVMPSWYYWHRDNSRRSLLHLPKLSKHNALGMLKKLKLPS